MRASLLAALQHYTQGRAGTYCMPCAMQSDPDDAWLCCALDGGGGYAASAASKALVGCQSGCVSVHDLASNKPAGKVSRPVLCCEQMHAQELARQTLQAGMPLSPIPSHQCACTGPFPLHLQHQVWEDTLALIAGNEAGGRGLVAVGGGKGRVALVDSRRAYKVCTARGRAQRGPWLYGVNVGGDGLALCLAWLKRRVPVHGSYPGPRQQRQPSKLCSPPLARRRRRACPATRAV